MNKYLRVKTCHHNIYIGIRIRYKLVSNKIVCPIL